MRQPLVKRIALVLFVILIMIQIFPGERPEVIEENPDDIHAELLIGADVSGILRSACYDCHSNESTFPWYSNIAPVSWLINHDIEEGRSELNFSDWKTYSAKRKHHKLDEIIEEVEEGEMPMKIYTFTHADARLDEQQIAMLTAWAKEEMGKIDVD